MRQPRGKAQQASKWACDAQDAPMQRVDNKKLGLSEGADRLFIMYNSILMSMAFRQQSLGRCSSVVKFYVGSGKNYEPSDRGRFNRQTIFEGPGRLYKGFILI